MKFSGRIAVFGGREITESIYNDTVEIGRKMAKEKQAALYHCKLVVMA